MLWKDFENLEVRLQKIREESSEIFEESEKVFWEKYEKQMKALFSRDILGARKNIKALFQLKYVDTVQCEKKRDSKEIFRLSVEKVIATFPLSLEEKQQLSTKILSLWEKNIIELNKYYQLNSLEMDPLYPLIEELLQDEEISFEEIFLLQKSYQSHKNLQTALEYVPENMRSLILQSISPIFSLGEWDGEEAFRNEYHQDIRTIEQKGLNIFPLIRFISRSYFRNPGKFKKRESARRRMRRTFKMALLRILRMKFGSIDAQKLMKQFDQCETFTEMMHLLYQLFEILGENSEMKESFQAIEEIEFVDKLIIKAEHTKEKILQWEQITARVSNIISDTDARLEEGILERVLDSDTHFHGDEILFAHGDDDMAGIYAETTDISEDEKDEDDVVDEGDTLQGNYQRLKDRFQEVEEEKRKAFLTGEYDKIDVFNERLLHLESKMEKISKLLGEE